MKLIDKDAVVAQANIEITGCRLAAQQGILTEFGKGKLEGLEGIVDFLDTLEVKEMDLDREIDLWVRNLHRVPNFEELNKFARHFFELGLKAIQK